MVLPTGLTVLRSRTRSSLGCISRGSSPISSRKRVPPSASRKAPATRRDRAGEGPPLVPEELALDQVRREGSAVDHDEGPLRAGAELVDRVRRQLLARARTRRGGGPLTRWRRSEPGVRRRPAWRPNDRRAPGGSLPQTRAGGSDLWRARPGWWWSRDGSGCPPRGPLQRRELHRRSCRWCSEGPGSSRASLRRQFHSGNVRPWDRRAPGHWSCGSRSRSAQRRAARSGPPLLRAGCRGGSRWRLRSLSGSRWWARRSWEGPGIGDRGAAGSAGRRGADGRG